MSVDKAANPCNKFQANIFNKNKCQNCFKPRELHLMSDDEREQAKPIYGGWLCLAPEGTDFDNPAQRSRKWQRRFFILYENGNLSFALDELMSTLPQGTVDMTSCTAVVDAEPLTGQRNALRLATPQQDLFIRGESREMISGWCEQIAGIQRNNQHRSSRKHSVGRDPAQEACPAKMATPGSCLLEGVGSQPTEPGAGLRKAAKLGGGRSWTGSDTGPLGPSQPSSGNKLQCPATTSRGRSSSAGTEVKPATRWRGAASASPKRDRPANDRRLDQMQKANQETACPTATDTKLEGDQLESRMGRGEARVNKREKTQPCGVGSHVSIMQRRAKSLDRRTLDAIKTPDLLNFKKGWMVKLEQDQWRKFWFVLSADSLRYYRDSIAEEVFWAFDLQGEINLTKCYEVSEYQVLRNYGFQIHTRRGVHTLSAMTAGIRKNWIQALMKNVSHAHAPKVVSFPGIHFPTEALPKPDVTHDSPFKGPREEAPHHKDTPKNLQDRRRDDGGKASDWTEFRPLSESSLELEIRSGEPGSPDTLNQERKKRRQQRRKRYESILGVAQSRETAGDEGVGGRELDPPGGTSGPQQILVEEEDMEKFWIQVERTTFRVERVVPLFPEAADEDTVELQRLMETYRQGVEDLKCCLEESDCRRLELEAQLRTTGFSHQETCPMMDSTLSPEKEGDSLGRRGSVPLSGHAQSLKKLYLETRGLLQQQNDIRQSMQEQLGISLSPVESQGSPPSQAPSIWLHDTNGNQQELGGLHPVFPSSPTTAAPSLVSDDEVSLLHYNRERLTSNIQTHLDREAYQDVTSSDTHTNKTTWDGKGLDQDHQQTHNLFESPCGQDEPTVARLLQEVELLRGQNKALHQHNQEMLNQLTEADREIERLKADVRHLPEMERWSKTRVALLETELNSRNQGLMEAKLLIASLEQRLSKVESQALRSAALQAPTISEDTDESGVEVDEPMADSESKRCLLRCFEATEAKLIDLERKLHQSEQSCSELRSCNVEMEEAWRTWGRRTAELEAELARLSTELEKEKSSERQKIPDEEQFLKVSEGTGMASRDQGKLIKMIDRSDVRSIERQQEATESTLASYLQRDEDELWGTMLIRIKADSSQTAEDKLLCVLLMEVTEHRLIERKLLLLAKDFLLEKASCTSIGGASLVEIDEGTYSNGTGSLVTPENENWSDVTGTMDIAKHIGNDFCIQQNIYLLNFITSIDNSSTSDKLKLLGQRLCKYYRSGHHWLHRVQSSGKLNENQQQGQLITSPTCTNCVSLGKENKELRAEVSFLEKEIEKASAGTKTPSTNLLGENKESQTPSIWLLDTRSNLQMMGESNHEVPSTLNAAKPSPVSDHAMVDRIQSMGRSQDKGPSWHDSKESSYREVGNTEKSNQGGDVGLDKKEEEVEDDEEEGAKEGRVVRLRGQVAELEQQLCLVAEVLRAEHEGIIGTLRLQHEKDVETLKAACESGLSALEVSQQRALEGVRLHHQGELQRLVTEQDRLLEEETSATVTAIESMKRAFQLQLDRQTDKTHQARLSADNTHLQETQRQHREELEVVVQQFSLQRLENSLLSRALEAERTALCQSGQENRELKERNQELSGLLATELSRLRSRSKQEASPLGQGASVFEQEMSLRMKEWEIQGLRREVSSLREELLLSHSDHSLAVQQQTASSTELTVLKVRFQGDMDVLQENLRLAHRALEQTIP
ncbi:myosin phosphatase Rho-interacting protein-like isoform X1 [Gadus chalcogrammus]|uniref:myosin phosphatase Rho-interacting protein-like isoform X1 n=1 Tax=Gadus chalcogrammus TaxID=1042646 RepID=UPI0024C445AD|nr:myosin phosphatase Rho-interacting protein-like isoform X1 [Gadus chalcogrammus]